MADYVIKIWFYVDDDDDDCVKYECSAQELPMTLKSIDNIVSNHIRETTSHPYKYDVNGNVFYTLPTIHDIKNMSLNNPYLAAKFKQIMKEYPEIIKVGFNGFDMFTRGYPGDITLMHDAQDMRVIYAAIHLIENLYCVDNVEVYVSELRSLDDTGFYKEYVRGVDF